MELLNSLQRLIPNIGFVAGTITTPNPISGTPTLSNLTGTADFDQTQVTVTRTSTGIYPVVITNFNSGSSSIGIGFASASTTGTSANAVVMANVQPATFSGDTATFTISCVTGSNSLAVDAQVNFLFLTYSS